MISSEFSMAAAHAEVKPHAVVLAYPLIGHINPALALSKRLARAGARVSLVSAGFALSMEQLQGEVKKESEDIRWLAVPPAHFPAAVPANPVDFIYEMHATMQASFEKLVLDPPITCIIADFAFTWLPPVAARWGVPWACFWPNSMACLAWNLRVPQIMSGPSAFDPFQAQVYDGSLEDRLLQDGPGLPPMHASDLPFKSVFGEGSARLTYEQNREFVENLPKAHSVLVNSFDGLEEEAGEAVRATIRNLHMVGPLLRDCDDARAREGECLRWLDAREARSVLYISMGSLFFFTKEQVEEIGHGLAAARQPFLWVLRTKGMLLRGKDEAQMGVEAVEELVRRGQGRVVEWAPQPQVLAHEAVGGFLTHCGWNSTLESMAAGVPMIAWPQFLDQLTNCVWVVERWKVGTRLLVPGGGKRPQQLGVAQAVRRVMQEGAASASMRARISELQAKARDALTAAAASSPAAATTTLHHFVDDLRAQRRWTPA